MTTRDEVTELVTAGLAGDRARLEQAVERLIANERAKHHDTFAERLEAAVRRVGKTPRGLAVQNSRGQRIDALVRVIPGWTIQELDLDPFVREEIRLLVEEHRRADELREAGLAPRNTVLLWGPPGNGKTSLAGALANELGRALMVVDYAGLIGSYLGETGARLKKIFQHIANEPCVMFFDEMDTIAKERGDAHEVGEMKRVVANLLLEMDALGPDTILVGASNHAGLFDIGAWRRFDLKLRMDGPARGTVARWTRKIAREAGIEASVVDTMLGEWREQWSHAGLAGVHGEVARTKVLADSIGRTQVRDRIASWVRQNAKEQA